MATYVLQQNTFWLRTVFDTNLVSSLYFQFIFGMGFAIQPSGDAQVTCGRIQSEGVSGVCRRSTYKRVSHRRCSFCAGRIPVACTDLQAKRGLVLNCMRIICRFQQIKRTQLVVSKLIGIKRSGHR